MLAPRTVNANIYYTSDGPDICAAATPFGSGCSSCFASCYEFFPTPAAFTLASRSITMVPTDPGYTVVAGFTPVLPRSNAAVALTLADDDEVTVPLAPGSFRGCYGQPWSAMSICSNGRVSEAPSNGLVAAPSIPTMLGNLYTAFYSQGDWNPAAGGTVWFDPGPTTTVTWDNVPSFGVPGSSNTFQMQFDGNGVVTLCWETMSVSGVNGGILVGYSPGGPSADPGPKDLAAFFPPFDLCCDDERPLALSTFAGDRPVQPLSGPADPFQVLTTNIHPLDVIHVGVLGLSNLGTAGWPLFSFGFGLGDCHLYCQPDAVFLSVLPPATTAWQWTAANLFPPGPDYKSIQFCVQSLTLRPPSPGPSDRASNALACIVGNQ
ncbi:MAG: hypothetical protein JNK49_01350 [Planctomycetes bacterium]|nr:hypothetical protein [Planctomycetota bacterium]